MLPNLLIAGTQKAGTTWLHSQLERHPDVYMSEVKEINFLHSGKGRIEDYERHFEGSFGCEWRGESTPHYFWRRDARCRYSQGRAHDTATFASAVLGSDIRIIVSLRDPVSRAISAFYHHHAMGRLPLNLSIFDCPPRLGVIDLGFYKRHWEHWAGVFGSKNICAFLFDDLLQSPAHYLESVLNCLGLNSDPLGTIDVARRGDRKRVDELRRTNRNFRTGDIRKLVDIYREDISFVESLLDRNLSHWRDVDALVKAHCYNSGAGV